MLTHLALTTGAIAEKVRSARAHLASCALCPRRCGASRLEGRRGFCGQGGTARIARALPHFGEEPPLSGGRGAGTIFFSGCTMRCLFCQNYQISHHGMGDDVSAGELARVMLSLQQRGCHNIELVSPTPHIPFIVEALERAAAEGLFLPIVYNSNGYVTPEALALLDGLVDIYLPDMKFGDDGSSRLLAAAPDYTEHNRAAVREMARQAGALLLDEAGIAERGTLVRLLLLPHGLERAEESMRFLPGSASLSIMSQYAPLHRAAEIPALLDGVPEGRAQELAALALELGITDLWVQEPGAQALFLPDFRQDNPFGEENRGAC